MVQSWCSVRNMDAFTTPMRPSGFTLAPKVLAPRRRKRCSSDSSKEESPFAQLLFDTPEILSQPLFETPGSKTPEILSPLLFETPEILRQLVEGPSPTPTGQEKGEEEPQGSLLFQNMDAFDTPVRPPGFVLSPKVLLPRRRKRYISSLEEETLDPETPEILRQQTEDLSPTPKEQEKGEEEPQACVAMGNQDEAGPSCFCSTSMHVEYKQAAEEAYEKFVRKLSLDEAEAVPVRQRKRVMRSVMRIAVYVTLDYCLKEKMHEDCEGCVIDAPGQRSHDCTTWTSEDINSKLRGLCANLCFESLSAVIAISYILKCLYITEELLDSGISMVQAVQFYSDPANALYRLKRPSDKDAWLCDPVDRLIRTKHYKSLLRRPTMCQKSKRIKSESGEGSYMRYKPSC